MNIDWFTFVAQIINFLMLVFLLRWFLYDPIVRAMQKREDKIAAELEHGQALQSEGAAQAQHFEQKIRELDEQRDALLREARRESDEQRKRLTKEAQEAVQRKRTEWLEGFAREQESLLAEVRQQVGQLSAKATRRVLAELADVSLEERMFETFLKRLRNLDVAQQNTISSFLKDSKDLVFVRSAFPVSESSRGLLQATMQEEFGYEGQIEYETTHELIAGIELNAGGYGFGWNVDEFLRSMEAEFQTRLTSNPRGDHQ